MEKENNIVLESTQIVSDEQRKELLEITTTIELIESKLKSYAELEKEYENFRKKLFEAMTAYGVTKYVSEGGIQFTVTAQSADKTEILLQFDVEKFKVEKPDLYKQYLKQIEKITKGKASHLRITIPKTKEIEGER